VAYAQSRRDFEYLETIIEVSDMVEIDAEMINLMENPTKNNAAEIYQSAIEIWFSEHSWREIGKINRRVAAIARRANK